MKFIMISAILVIVMTANITDCHHFMTGLSGFPGRGFPFPSRRDPFSRQEILQKMDRMEHRVNQYLDAAIGFETRRNATDVQVLQEIRSTDVPQFFNSLRQKLNATVPVTGTTIEGGAIVAPITGVNGTGSVAIGA